MSGRYATERQVLDDVRDLDDAHRRRGATQQGPRADAATLDDFSAGRLTAAREAAGVERGEYDGQTPTGLAGFAPQQAQAFAEIIRRAARAD